MIQINKEEIKLNQVLYGKSEEKLKEFPDNFFDGIITDPPYELGFMNKDWDKSGITYDTEMWKEVLRVAKPGSFLLCFGGTRTVHRIAVSIEDAGWIIRDRIMWIYGEGFPKSTNIGKQLDKEAGVEREVIGQRHRNVKPFDDNSGWNQNNTTGDCDVTAPATNDAKRWDGYGTALKPAHEPIIVAMKPLEKGLTYAQNAKKWDVAGLNIDGGRVGFCSQKDETENNRLNRLRKVDKKYDGWGLNSEEHSINQNSQGRWPSNIILSHSPDCVCVGTKIINEGAPEGGYVYNDREHKVEGFVKDCKPQAPSNRGQETVEVYACVPNCPIRIMDSQSGKVGGFYRPNLRDKKYKNKFVEHSYNEIDFGKVNMYNDSGGASRFFYCAKAKRSEKEAGLIEFVPCIKCDNFNSKTHTIKGKQENCIRNGHPTVKPLDIMWYLLNLIKMPSSKENKQVILDPFCGSGTTLVACEQLGINYIGIEQNLDNVLISTARIGA